MKNINLLKQTVDYYQKLCLHVTSGWLCTKMSTKMIVIKNCAYKDLVKGDTKEGIAQYIKKIKGIAPNILSI